jgi:hypothetical protein
LQAEADLEIVVGKEASVTRVLEHELPFARLEVDGVHVVQRRFAVVQSDQDGARFVV